MKVKVDLSTPLLYNSDYHKWLEITIEQLRSNHFSELDLENLIEELLAMGKTEIRTANSLIKQLIIHRLKLDKLPNLESRKHWQKEINNFQEQLEDLLSSYLKEKINLEKIYSRAKKEILLDYAIELPQECPYSLAELLTT